MVGRVLFIRLSWLPMVSMAPGESALFVPAHGRRELITPILLSLSGLFFMLCHVLRGWQGSAAGRTARMACSAFPPVQDSP